MELENFINIMREIGFDLVKYYADVYYRQETGLSPLINIVNNEQMELTYSGCWFGGEFFKWLFPQDSISTDRINPLKIIHGYFSSDQECHYFLIISTKDQAIILNTYGGITSLLINILPLYEANLFLKRVNENDVLAIEPLFGFTPDYDTMIIEDFALTESGYYLPTQEQLINKINYLLNSAYTIEDKNELYRLRNLIQFQ